MYHCSKCNKVIGPNISCNKIVTQTRQKRYPCRPKVHPGYFTTPEGELKRSNSNFLRQDDPGGDGWETVKEVFMCPVCCEKKV